MVRIRYCCVQSQRDAVLMADCWSTKTVFDTESIMASTFDIQGATPWPAASCSSTR